MTDEVLSSEEIESLSKSCERQALGADFKDPCYINVGSFHALLRSHRALAAKLADSCALAGRMVLPAFQGAVTVVLEWRYPLSKAEWGLMCRALEGLADVITAKEPRIEQAPALSDQPSAQAGGEGRCD